MKRMYLILPIIALSIISSRGAIRLQRGTLEHGAERSILGVVDQASLNAASCGKGQRTACLIEYAEPIRGADRLALERLGVEVISYIPDHTLLVLLRAGQVEAVAKLEHVKWVGGYLPEYKLAASLPGRPGDVEVLITVMGRHLGHVLTRLREFGVSVLSANGRSVQVRLHTDDLYAVASISEVEWIEPVQAVHALNDVAMEAPRVNVQEVWNRQGLTGAGQIVAMSDGGLDTGLTNTLHPDLKGRLRAAFGWKTKDVWADFTGHGTHAAGSLLGSGAAWSNGLYRGVAYEAELVFQAIGDPLGGPGLYPPSPLSKLFEQAHTNGARIHSDSWGGPAAGRYSSYSREVDEYMWEQDDMLVVFAAGNSGVDADGDGVIDLQSINVPGTAKNCLTVGTAESLRAPGSGGHSSETWAEWAWTGDVPGEPIAADLQSMPKDGVHQGVAAISSRGPCADGRMKPDMLAPGTDIVSCRSQMPMAGELWGTGSGVLAGAVSNWYCFSGGSSAATPLVSGCAALVRQYLVERAGITNPCAALIKALLAGGARSLSPGQYGTGAAREIPASRPNVVEGWGQVNLEETLYPASGGAVQVWNRGRLQSGETNRFLLQVTNESPMCVMLCWSDYPASLTAAQQLVNDLDVYLISPDGERYYPGGDTTFDRVNNLVGIELPAQATGVYEVVLSGFNVPEGPQPYALMARFDGYVVPKQQLLFAQCKEPRIFEGEEITVQSILTTNRSGVASVVTVYRVNDGAWSYAPQELTSFDGVLQGYGTQLSAMAAGDTLEYYTYCMGCDLTWDVSETNQVLVEGKSLYVAPEGSSTWPYDNWDDAFTSLVDAVSFAGEGFTIYVTNGIYQEGEPVVIDKVLWLQSVNGAGVTIVDGENSWVCMELRAEALVSGFSLVNGYAEKGGCVYLSQGMVSNCVLRGGQAEEFGGGAYLDEGVITHSRICSNRAGAAGGGAHVNGGELRNCVISDNQSDMDAGGIEQWGGVILNGTIAFNHADRIGGGVDIGSTRTELRNCIIVSNTAGEQGDNWYRWNETDARYCCSEPLLPGVGNFVASPLFADDAARDVHLQSRWGRFVSAGVWTQDVQSSACLAMGDPSSAYAEEPEPNGHRINLGAYGGTDEASLRGDDSFTLIVQSYSDTAIPPCGNYSYPAGQLVACALTNPVVRNGTTQHLAAGWRLEGVEDAANHTNQGAGGNVLFAMTNHTLLFWTWSNLYYVSVQEVEHGQIKGVENGWYVEGREIEATALPVNYYGFAHWSGSVSSTTNPLLLALDGALELGAVFEPFVTTRGVPYDWLAAYGWTNQFEEAEQADQDSDRLATWQEYVAGTDPTNEHSVLALCIAKKGDDALQLGWAAVSNRTYSLCGLDGTTNPPQELFTAHIQTDQFVEVDTVISTHQDRVWYQLEVTRDEN